MNKAQDLPSCRYEVSQNADGTLTLHLQGRMDAATAADTITGIKSVLQPPLPDALTVAVLKISANAITHPKTSMTPTNA